MNRVIRVLLATLLAIVLTIIVVISRFYVFMDNIQPTEDLSALLTEISELPQEVKEEKVNTINGLLLGVDEGHGRSDTMIVFSYNPLSNKGVVMSIPRDTLVDLGPEYGMQKIGHAYAYGGINKSIKTVKELVGIDIHYFARLKYDTLHKFVDEIGGVPINIKHKMYYDDFHADLHIHFEKGDYVLDGKQAENYLRWRKNNDLTGDGLGDIGRIQRQQKFMRAFFKQVIRPKNLLKANNLIKIAENNLTTNVDFAAIIKYSDNVIRMDVHEDVKWTTLPGRLGKKGIHWVMTNEDKTILKEIRTFIK